MRPRYWVLEKDHSVREGTREEWGEQIEDPRTRRVGYTRVGKLRVSTVFLGIDHNFLEDGPPLLFETMVFGDESELQERYSTYEEALIGHRATVALMRARGHRG